MSVLLLLGACGPSSLPAPVIRDIHPSALDASESGTVQVDVSVVLPFRADYGAGTLSEDTSLVLRIGPWVVGDGRDHPGGTLTALLPSGLAPGDYDVSVTLGDGRSSKLPAAFTVRPGHWPTRYTFDAIADQQDGRPFGITVRAEGDQAAHFHGNVTFSVEGGTVTPSVSHAFVEGLLVQSVAVTRLERGKKVQLVVTDGSGASGQSNGFELSAAAGSLRSTVSAR